jgi:hypothetical protein
MRSLLVSAAVAAILLTGVALGQPGAAVGDTSATGAGSGVFPPGALWTGVSLSGSTLGFGVEIHADGTALGEFETVLVGTSALGAAQEISVEGDVTAGSQNSDGSVTFSGTGTVDLGNGQVQTGVPFSVTATTAGLQLVLSGTTLPAQTLGSGTITIQ